MRTAVGDPSLAALHVYAPDVPPALDAALAHAADLLPGGLVEELEHTVDRVLVGHDAAAVGTPLSDFVEQFVVYVPGITEEQRSAAALVSERNRVDLRTAVEALYVVDQRARQRLLQPQLHPGLAAEGSAGTGSVAEAPRPDTLDGSLRDLHAAAMRLGHIDPVTTELVRMRCAHHHDCAT
jgi:hypothetical protein